MVKLNRLAISGALLLASTGCSKATHYHMGKSDEIAAEAQNCEGDTDWAKNVAKKPEYHKFVKTFPAGTWKCNLFIADMLYRAGITPPGTNDEKSITSNGIWPIRAHQWQGSVPGWSKVSSQTRGDIVSNGVHCGIAVSSTETISAGAEKVLEHNNITGATIQRYN